jgi:hypothetical protein
MCSMHVPLLIHCVSSFYLCPPACCATPCVGSRNSTVSASKPQSHSTFLVASLCITMPHLSADVKHTILLEYQPRSPTHSFVALAQRHGIAGGEWMVRNWHSRWDGTSQSLEERPRTGRPRILSRAQISRHIRAPILAANRAHRAIHYTTLLPTVRQKTGGTISLRTLQRYGKQELHVKDKHSKKRTAQESECTHTYESEHVSL